MCSMPSRKKATAPEMTGVAHSYTCQIATGRHISQMIRKREVCLQPQANTSQGCVGKLLRRQPCQQEANGVTRACETANASR